MVSTMASASTGSVGRGDVHCCLGYVWFGEFHHDGEYAPILRGDPALVSGTSTVCIVKTPCFDRWLNSQDLRLLLSRARMALMSLKRAVSRPPLEPFRAPRTPQCSSSVFLAGQPNSVQLSHSMSIHLPPHTLYFPVKDEFVAAGDPLAVALAGGSANQGWNLEASSQIPIDIKVQSVT